VSTPYVITSDCNQCGACISGCEAGAIKEEADRNRIDGAIFVGPLCLKGLPA
jgi:AhpD family alkylhydroperoxidase